MKNKIKILFEVNDTDKIKLGKSLNVKRIDNDGFDWSVESMLVAIGIAYDNGINIDYKYSGENWEANFNCKINGVIYNVIDSNKGMKIKRLNKIFNYMTRLECIENLIDLADAEIKSLYMRWDKGDCSEVGLCEILLYQIIKEHKLQNGEFYDTDYDIIKLRYGK